MHNMNQIEFDNEFKQPWVFITISAIVDTKGQFSKMDKRLILHWRNLKNFLLGDIVAVFSEDPSILESSSMVSKALHKCEIKDPSGYELTSIQLQREVFSADSDSLGYWIAYIRNLGSVWKVDCFNEFICRPNWMESLREEIGDIPLISLMIPGTHNSGSVRKYDADECENLITRFAVCQEESLYHQLYYGIRYFDIRLAKDSEQGLYLITHGWYQAIPLQKAIEDIASFLADRKEVIFIDIHSIVNGFYTMEDHRKFIRHIFAKLGKFLFKKPRSIPVPDITLNQIMKENKRIIFSYANASIVEDYEYVWPSVVHEWGNKTNAEDLHDYVSTVLNNSDSKPYFRSLMAEITPDFWNWLFDYNKGLRGFANEVNNDLDTWIVQQPMLMSLMIISTDFFLGNNMVEIAVKVNKLKGKRA